MELAQELKLQLKGISHKPITLSGFDRKNEVKYIAEEVCVGAYGVKRRGFLHLTQTDFGEARIRFEKGALQRTFA